jgi:hypothetical protein
MVVAAASAALVAFAIYWIRGIGYLYDHHPHEDAYILFRYVENFVNGQGIAFNPGGPPTEGATDFLWMIGLSVLVRLGVDVARAVVWLNAIGCALMAYVIARVWLFAARPGVLAYAAPLVFAACLAWLPGAQASYDGFSLQLYCGLIAWLFWLWLQETPRSLAMLPYLALVVALFRPDGVLVGGGFFLVAVATRLRDRPALRALAIHGAVAALLGGLYFAWRWWYFGELLPLPLLVKSQGSGLVGLPANLRWMKEGVGPWPLLLCAAVFAAVLIAARRLASLRCLLALVPAGLLFAALSFAQQVQNIEWRFQAPIHVLVMLVMLRLSVGVVELVDLGPRWRPRDQSTPAASRRYGAVRALVTAAAVAGCLLALRPAIATGKRLFPRDYMDTFAVHVGPTLDDSVVVLTESGRLPYWTSGTMLDMVGLNLAATARKPPTLDYIAGLDPDVILFHVAGTLDFPRLRAHAPEQGSVSQIDPRNKQIVRIEPRSLPAALRPAFRAMRRDLPVAYDDTTPRVKTASVILGMYLAAHADEFNVYALPYGGAHDHIIGVRVGRKAVADFEAILARALDLRYESYAGARRWPRGTACGISRGVARLWGQPASSCGW